MDGRESAESAKVSTGWRNGAITVQAGLNDPKDPNVAVLQYMPAAVTVAVGQSVTWSWKGTIEPHSVTFFPPGQTIPSPDAATPFYPATPPSGPFSGATLVNSGLQPLGPAPVKPFTVTFGQPGTFTYHCIIHPNMVGTVTVVAAGGTADTASVVATREQSDQAKWLAEGRDAKKKLESETPLKTPNADGTTTWQVHMGASTPHTDVLAFAPTPAQVKPGDKVEFVNDSGAPHTAGFFGTTSKITNPEDPKTDPPAPGPSPQTLNTTGFFNTGLLPPNAPPGAGPPLAVRSFTFVVPAAGTYRYYCILHVSSGMAGTITAG